MLFYSLLHVFIIFNLTSLEKKSCTNSKYCDTLIWLIKQMGTCQQHAQISYDKTLVIIICFYILKAYKQQIKYTESQLLHTLKHTQLKAMSQIQSKKKHTK